MLLPMRINYECNPSVCDRVCMCVCVFASIYICICTITNHDVTV